MFVHLRDLLGKDAAARGLKSTKTRTRSFQPRFEEFEARTLLSTLAGEGPGDETAQVSATQAEQALSIVALHLRISNSHGVRDVVVTSSNDEVQVQEGDLFEVVGVDYELAAGTEMYGKIAFEGYLRKLADGDDGRGEFDYRDGRTGKSVQTGLIPEGNSHHPGLKSGWEMEVGWNRLSVAMVRYWQGEVVVEDRFFVNTQVVQPDFVIQPQVGRFNGEVIVGHEVKIKGGWSNEGEGRYFTYSEVDIFHTSDPTKLVWVGSINGVTGPGEKVKGEYIQKHAEKPYTPRWTPDQPGTYVIKFYVDPEFKWSESDESNNVFTLRVDVRPQFKNKGPATGVGELKKSGEDVTPPPPPPGKAALDDSVDLLFEQAGAPGTNNSGNGSAPEGTPPEQPGWQSNGAANPSSGAQNSGKSKGKGGASQLFDEVWASDPDDWAHDLPDGLFGT